MNSDINSQLILWAIVLIVLFFASILIIRAIFNIPTIVRNGKAQVKLLEQIAKAQGVDEKKVTSIMAEITAWEQSN